MSFFSEITNEFASQQSQFWNYTKDSLKHPALKNVYYAVFLAYLLCFFLELLSIALKSSFLNCFLRKLSIT